MFACAIRGGPVALVESDERGAQRHWSEAALGIAGVDIDTPVELPLGDGDADHADEAAEHELLRARVLRGLAWRRAGTAAFDVEAFLGRSPEPARMRRLLAACEAIRVRPVIARMYPGAACGLARLDAAERGALDAPGSASPATAKGREMAAGGFAGAGASIAAALARIRLGMPPAAADPVLPPELGAALSALARPDAATADSARCALACWRLERGDPLAMEALSAGEILPIPESPTSALPASTTGGEAGVAAGAGDDAEPGTEPGEAGRPGTGGEETAIPGLRPVAGSAATAAAEGIRVDEWDYLGRRFLRRWCRIVVTRPEPREVDYRAELLLRERAQARRLRRHFARLRDAATRRRRVFGDGEEIDADDMVRTLVERRAGIAGDEPRMLRREHARRDVAVALLLDVSASTDFVLRDAAAGKGAAADAGATSAAMADASPIEDDDPFLWSPTIFEASTDKDAPPPRRVIDVARDAMGLLAQAFESLGDRFALYAFSGSGREQVDFLVAKDFEEAMSPRGWKALAGLEPMRSTRMGAAIRHAADRLGRRPERMRVLMVVSDGYPDDIDYGPDRRSVEYGLRDTARAIEQARGRGIDTMLVTVDRAGHDYLRRICAPGRYRIIHEIDSLAGEIARAYRSMTA